MINKIKTLKELKKSGYISLDIKKEMLKSLKNADKLNTEWGKYIKDNPDVFKTAGIDLKKLKKHTLIKRLKVLIIILSVLKFKLTYLLKDKFF